MDNSNKIGNSLSNLIRTAQTQQTTSSVLSLSDTAALAAVKFSGPPPPAPTAHRKKRQSLGRSERLEVRVTPSEALLIRTRAENSGRSQGEYLRFMLLRLPTVPKTTPSPTSLELEALHQLQADIGRLGGILKSTIKPNEGSANISREEWEVVFAAIRSLEMLKSKIHSTITKLTGKTP